MDVVIDWDRAAVRETWGLPRALERAFLASGRRALRTTRAASTKAVRARKRMKAGRVRQALELKNPPSSARIEDMEWRMRVSPRAVPLSEYPVRQTARGVVVNVNKGKSVLLKSAFLATMRSGHRGVFTRRGPARLPIDEAFTSTVLNVLEDTGTLPAVLRQAQTTFSSTFAAVLPREIDRAKGRLRL